MSDSNQLDFSDKAIFKSHEDYFQVARNLRDIYMSTGSLVTLMDFERVLGALDVYAFKNWQFGELAQGPVVSKYRVTCIFMWPLHLMPDPRGGKRLLPFDCEVKFKKTVMKVPKRVNTPDDYRPGTKKARIVDTPIWLVEIAMPKSLMNDIKTGSVEIEGQLIDLQDLEDSYSEDVDQQQYQEDGGL